MNIFVFDIETVPDIATGRHLFNMPNGEDADVAKIMFNETNGDFLPHYLHRIITISAVLRTHDKLNVWSLGETSSDEKELIQRFFAGLEKYRPTLITWNGSGFDLPVLHYRSLLHGVTAQRYWEIGENDPTFRWNNYLNRYHYRHVDLMDVLAAYQARANAPLQGIATLLGLPGKLGMDGSQVWEYYLQNRLEDVRNYCETDVLNTYLIYLRFELMRGKLTEENYHDECEMVRHLLESEAADKAHFKEFLEGWRGDMKSRKKACHPRAGENPT